MRVSLIFWGHYNLVLFQVLNIGELYLLVLVLTLRLRKFSFILVTRLQMMLLRQRMAFLVDNLQYYLQARTVNAIFRVPL